MEAEDARNQNSDSAEIEWTVKEASASWKSFWSSWADDKGCPQDLFLMSVPLKDDLFLLAPVGIPQKGGGGERARSRVKRVTWSSLSEDPSRSVQKTDKHIHGQWLNTWAFFVILAIRRCLRKEMMSSRKRNDWASLALTGLPKRKQRMEAGWLYGKKISLRSNIGSRRAYKWDDSVHRL